ncbi:MAG: hypothetical protein AAF937_06565 [Planctomycetota bacterium]
MRDRMRDILGSATTVGLRRCTVVLAIAGLAVGSAAAQPEAPPIDLLEDEADSAPEGLPDPADDADPPALEGVPSGIAAIAYPFDHLRVEFATRHPELPLVEAMRDIDLPITVQGETLVPVVGSGLTLGELLDIRGVAIAPDAINAVADALVRELNRRGIVGVLVAPDPGLIDPETGEDLRNQGEGAGGELVLLIWVGVVEELRTVGSGDRRSASADPVNHPAHRRILDLSPAKPWDGRRGRREDLLRREVLENYVYRLNRHPGRRVDIAVAPASQPDAAPDAVALDYLVRESKPWTLYAQVSNTGTEATNEWRQRIGFVHRQLTGRDDVFTFDAVTASFDDTFGGLVSYEAPLPGTTLARLKGFGTFNEYVASDIGLPGQDLEGTTGTYGGELIVTAYQNRSLFVDPFFGLVGKQYEVINDLAGTESDVSLFLGTAGVRVEDRRPTRSFFGEVAVDWTFDGGDSNDLPGLGRLGVDDEWARLRWNTSASFFLEPLLFHESWSDPTSALATLGHEFVLAFRGQSALDSRLIPQEQGVVGGAFSVRGYPESVVAGDTVFIATAEYRAHLPALLGMAEAGSSGEGFRWRRDRPYGQADWDLILAGFVDLGQTIANDAEAGEFDETLVGAGFGVGLDIRRNVNVRADWGFALSDLDSGRASSGDSEVHFVATIAY